MKALFVLLALALVVMYTLMASNAVEFQTKTLDKTELVERVAMKPSFHAERLTAYLEKRWRELKKVVNP